MRTRLVGRVGVSACALMIVALARIAAPAAAAGQTPDERVMARTLADRRGAAVVMVMATLKARRVVGGREAQGDVPVQSNATVLDPTGLTVLPLSSLDPPASAFGRGGGDVSTEMTELRIRLNDGRELPARVVIRDTDLDLVLVKPVDAPPSPLPAIDATDGVPALADLVIAIQRASEASGYRTFVSFTYVQMVIDRPRPYYLVSLGPLNGSGALGAPFFDTSGKFLGILSQLGGTHANPRAGLAPVADLRELVKQSVGK